MKIGVISDTHGYFDPRLPEFLQGVDEILHAGDVGKAEVLDQLRMIAPVHAVRGNVDGDELGLPLTLTRRFGPVEIHMLHIPPKPQGALRQWAESSSRGANSGQQRRFLESLPPSSQVVIFGHSHEPCALILGGRLLFNPGSAGKRRFSLPRCGGLLEISAEGVRATFFSLERYNEELPESVSLPMGGINPCGKS